MGSDRGPQVVVEAAALLSQRREDLQLILVGDGRAVGPLLDAQSYEPRRLSLRHTAQWVTAGEAARQALQQKPAASVLVCSQMVAEGQADAVVTAGSTGALILAAERSLGRLPGVRRAALAAVVPTELRHGRGEDPFALLLDVGSTLQVTAQDLVSFAVMGSAYARIISDNPRPRVALLSNGSEPRKGPPEVVEAHALLGDLEGLEFLGNVEGLDIPRGTADVVVMGGFVGNVVLKMLEGFGEVISDLAQDQRSRHLLGRLGLDQLSSGARQIQSLLDWESYGGAPVLGFTHPVIKAHGRSGSRAIANACKVAAKVARSDMTQRIERAVRQQGSG
ncbi:MAG: phosphate acyltransferase PlsX [Rickettsiales bacterium]|nr:phosphate acyltransferase PlsX [Rickettsiales bacterium]